jgi:transcriptional regulatory protein RtcR
MEKPLVVIGLLGPVLDQGRGPTRWERWRPTVSVCQQEDLLVARFELLHQTRFVALANQLVADIATVSPETKVVTSVCDMEDAWDFEEVYGCLHDWAAKYPFKPDEEDYLVHITTGSHVAQICLFLLTESRDIPARLLQTAPPKRDDHDAGRHDIIDLDLSRYDRIAARFAKERDEGLSFLKGGIATRNARFNALIEQIERVAIRSSAPLLLLGPTGAGKSRLARRIHDLKKLRRQVQGELVEVNCATIRGDGAMSALFGHRKGAFTGATSDRAGLLKAADKGVLFLDEIGEIGLDEQAMLLRALEEKRFLPVGSDKESTSDFQLIAGTNRDLQSAVRAGTFREDLLARINLWTFSLPALRDRPEDIEPNLEYELDRFAEREGTRVTMNKEARERFLRFAASSDAMWCGNFRDLNAAVQRMCTLAASGRINVETVDDEIARLRVAWQVDRVDDDPLASILSPDALRQLDLFDRAQLECVVRTCRTSRSLSDAGRRLFAASLATRSTRNDADRLRKYLTRFGLSWASVSEK